MTPRHEPSEDGVELGHVRQIEAFVAVADALNIGRAAEHLGTTQPPVSRLLLRLERRVGLPLFERHSRGVSLTAEGAALLPAARQVLLAVRDFDRAAAEVSAGVTGVLRVGTTEGAGSMIAATLRLFRRRRPGVEVRLHHAHTPVKLEMVRRGELEAAFVRNPPHVPGLRHLDVVRVPLLAVVARDHPLAGDDRVDLAALAAYPLLLTPRHLNSGVHDAVLGCLVGAGITPRLGPPLLNETDGLTQVAASDHWTLLSQDAASAARPIVTSLEIADADLHGTITLTWSTRRTAPAVTDFVAAARAATSLTADG